MSLIVLAHFVLTAVAVLVVALVSGFGVTGRRGIGKADLSAGEAVLARVANSPARR